MRLFHKSSCFPLVAFLAFLLSCGSLNPSQAYAVAEFSKNRIEDQGDSAIAIALAELLHAGRLVISDQQIIINDPQKGDKGLDSSVVTDKISDQFSVISGYEMDKLDHGSVLYFQLDSLLLTMKETIDKNLPHINKKEVAYKEFGPDEFTKAVAKAFAAKTKDNVEIHITNSYSSLRSFWNRPDKWEKYAIEKRIQGALYPKGKPVVDHLKDGSKHIVRVAYPEYYAQSCLLCHGSPKAEKDITGTKREGKRPEDFAGIITVTIVKDSLTTH
ncbi:MAG: DUF3365 domain-containing protein [Alphaproteobacteria bacterium]|nr:DUF3365 domain-containing protein [Alphaproteobacteria bacterium]